MLIRLAITPQGYVRRTHQGRFSAGAKAYHAYLNALKALWREAAPGVVLPDTIGRVTFFLPMPRTWSTKKKTTMALTPHQSKPDASNLWKAVEDALAPGDDARIWCIGPVQKVWALDGAILMEIP